MAVDNKNGATDDRGVTPLMWLLQDLKSRGLPYAQIANNATRRGHVLYKQYVTKLAKGNVKKPGADMLAAIAAGIPDIYGVTEADLKTAASRSAEYYVEHDISIETGRLLNRVHQLSASGRRRWFRYATAILSVVADEERENATGGMVVGRDPGIPLGLGAEKMAERATDAAEERAAQNMEEQKRNRRRK